MNCFVSIEGKITKLWFSQNWDKFFLLFFFHWFCSISTYISSKFLATLKLIIIMFRPLVINDQKILLTLCTKFEMLVAPSKLISKLLKFCMMYFITKINKMGDEEVKHLKFDFSWITLMSQVPNSERENNISYGHFQVFVSEFSLYFWHNLFIIKRVSTHQFWNCQLLRLVSWYLWSKPYIPGNFV